MGNLDHLMGRNYRLAVIIVGGVFPDDVPRGEWWQRCRDADLVMGRVSTHTRRVIKDRFGPPRDISMAEWDKLYSSVSGEKLTLEVA